MKTANLTVPKNGLRVVLVPCEAESVAVGIFVSSGSRHETAKTAGISHLIEHMLFKGTPTRRPIDITRAIEGRGGNFNAMTGEDATCYFGTGGDSPRETRGLQGFSRYGKAAPALQQGRGALATSVLSAEPEAPRETRGLQTVGGWNGRSEVYARLRGGDRVN